MGTSRGVVTALVVAVLMVGAGPAVSEAAAYSFAIGVTGPGITGSGSVLFPSDAGADSGGVDLLLNVTLFGNAVSFTEADILSIDWSGADPGDLIPLVINNLALGLFLGADTFVLSDDGGGIGSAICTDASDPFTACGGAEIALDEATWSYTAQQPPPVPEPSMTVALLAGLGFVMRQRLMRRARP
jgi:hypothetical protein